MRELETDCCQISKDEKAQKTLSEDLQSLSNRVLQSEGDSSAFLKDALATGKALLDRVQRLDMMPNIRRLSLNEIQRQLSSSVRSHFEESKQVLKQLAEVCHRIIREVKHIVVLP